MEALRWIGTIIYFTMLVCLSCYGIHRYWMIFLYLRHRREVPRPAGRLPELPKVTVQLPLYNEMYVAERLLDAVAALDYPPRQPPRLQGGRVGERSPPGHG